MNHKQIDWEEDSIYQTYKTCERITPSIPFEIASNSSINSNLKGTEEYDL